MNSKGDTFNGNTKVSSSSGQTISYDIPKPTITGQDPSKLSVNFDEVTIRERILVEGGTSGYVLSQFDGPVTMTRSLRVKGKTTLNGQLRVTYKEKAINENSGSIVSKGGIGVGDDSYFREKVDILGQLKTYTGIVPDEDLGAYIGNTNNAYSEAHIGNIKIGSTTDNTIDTRSGGLTINATSGVLTCTASNAIIVNAVGSGITITSGPGDIVVSTGIGRSVGVNTSTYIVGDLDVHGSAFPPHAKYSGTIRADYLDVPNVTPIGSVVMWAGRSNNLPNVSGIAMWEICTGQDLNTYTYRKLHSIISNTFGGTAYNEGVTDQSGSTTTFKLPDMKNRFIVGSSGNSGATLETDESGVLLSAKRTGGSKDSVLVTHNHDLSTSTEGSDEGAHTHTVTIALSGSLNMTGSAPNPSGTHNHSGDVTAVNAPHSHPQSTHNHNLFGNIYSGSEGDLIAGQIIANRFEDPGNTNEYNLKRAPNQFADAGISGPGGGDTISGNAPHSHPFSITSQGGHGHPVSTSGADHGHPGSTVNGSGTHTHTVSTEGESKTNKNLPPYYALYYIMRVV